MKMAGARPPTHRRQEGGGINNGQGYSVVIISDSRGAGLQNEINLLNEKGYQVKVLVYKGRGMAQAVREATNKLIWMKPNHVLILAGICDITRKD